MPARFQLVAAMNPCPCGWAGDPSGRCTCPHRPPGSVCGARLGAVAGPDRPLGRRAAGGARGAAGAARTGRRRRWSRHGSQRYGRASWRCVGASPDGCRVARSGPPACSTRAPNGRAIRLADAAGLTARGTERLLRVARTIADLDSAERVAVQPPRGGRALPRPGLRCPFRAGRVTCSGWGGPAPGASGEPAASRWPARRRGPDPVGVGATTARGPPRPVRATRVDPRRGLRGRSVCRCPDDRRGRCLGGPRGGGWHRAGRRWRRVLAAVGSGRAVLRTAADPGGPRRLADAVAAHGGRLDAALARAIAEAAQQAPALAQRVRALGITVVTIESAAYPERLRLLELPPPVSVRPRRPSVARRGPIRRGRGDAAGIRTWPQDRRCHRRGTRQRGRARRVGAGRRHRRCRARRRSGQRRAHCGGPRVRP